MNYLGKYLITTIVLLVLANNSFAQTFKGDVYGQARQTQSYVFVFFVQDGCGPCEAMKKVFADNQRPILKITDSTGIKLQPFPSPRELISSFVVLTYNISKPEDWMIYDAYEKACRASTRYKTIYGTPSFILINPNDLTNVGSVDKPMISAHSGYLNSDEFVKWVYEAAFADQQLIKKSQK